LNGRGHPDVARPIESSLFFNAFEEFSANGHPSRTPHIAGHQQYAVGAQAGKKRPIAPDHCQLVVVRPMPRRAVFDLVGDRLDLNTLKIDPLISPELLATKIQLAFAGESLGPTAR
jgi:hypothetical protein